MKFHKLHIVSSRPWPLVSSISSFSLTISTRLAFYHKTPSIAVLAITSLIFSASQWWRDVNRESSIQGEHSIKVVNGLKIGFILFIISEIIFFISFFFSLFNARQISALSFNYLWPPIGITYFNYLDIPLLNTIVLLTSGITVTWAHHLYLNKNTLQATILIFITFILGCYFTYLQTIEYWRAEFSLRDSIYGASFFITTGFHGLHVIIGSTFLVYVSVKIIYLSNSPKHSFGIEAAIWYWHFVDIVWLGVYYSFYYWNNFLHSRVPSPLSS